MVMDGGRVVAFDTHENLLKSCKLYKFQSYLFVTNRAVIFFSDRSVHDPQATDASFWTGCEK